MASIKNSSSIQALTLALAGAAAVVPNEAEACTPGYCAYTDAWQGLEPINAQAIPSDGVLLLQGARTGNSSEDDWLDKVELTVTRDGQPIAGAVEASGVRDVLLWRPAAPLEPGDYKVVGGLDNPEYDVVYEYCAVDLELDFEFSVDAEPSAPLSPPQVGTQPTLSVRESDDLEDLVCCDGAMPYSYAFDCGGSGEYVAWGDGFCTGLRGFGTLRVQVSIGTDLPQSTSALVMREVLVDGSPQRGELVDVQTAHLTKPACVAVRLTNLATGESVQSEESCHGDEPEIAAQLGDHAIDPGPALMQQCSQGAYTCELLPDQGRWDPDNCAPWPGEEATTGDPTEGPTTGGPTSEGSAGSEGSEGGGESEGTDGPASGGADELVEHGCACDSRTPSPFGALALLGLGLLRPRRRRRPPG
ncbi:hypothetical protein [Nannocystis radixulma]|uniref:MYXO-CTERM domain-containing protein n=1 Tax=Nannocystis radixulma TaxID=2995305 RepID=A0ABT5B7Z4_9BACT|nr:hypothetical protein [Nannocystis radixulma]MDC0669775.1 hypothetical protein [Nannocystis radixulma]